ncbi:hypothetical protein BX661DRAFT_168257 [Kickxella alabastrina]|uniref:uncharacterized protein n=1 Tax=Kickxella alabastrina TaxID=61397 RepID=UPI00221FD9C1|nr:uncharacterized protein BX661DRAFT_168257 [Kickxella alabastrina]KAI7835090.1 hypothetical protein BX661DRAFT_168257 [Kickxella alabastrina]
MCKKKNTAVSFGLAASSTPNLILVICILALMVNFTVLVYSYIKREYTPLKSQNLSNMYFTYVSMVMSFIGSVFIGSSRYAVKEWAVCAVTIGWLVYAALAFVLDSNAGYGYDIKSNMCIVQSPIFLAGMGVLIIQGLVVCGMLVKARKMESCFGEFKKMLIVTGILTLSGILTIAFKYAKFGPDGQVLAGILKLLAVFIPQQAYFYIILGPPIYHSLRDSEAYYRVFVERIEKQGLAQLYKMASKCYMGEISNMSESGRSRYASMQSNFSGNMPAPVTTSQVPRDNVAESHRPSWYIPFT